MSEFDTEKKLYFNKYEFLKAKEPERTDPYLSIKRFQEYLEKYPKDYGAYVYYAVSLINVRQLDKAEEILDFAEESLKTNNVYLFDEKKAAILDKKIKMCKLKLYMYQNRIKELSDLYYQNIDSFSDLGNEVNFYIRKLNKKIDQERRIPNSYIFRQIVKYEESDFREHIKKHEADYNENDRSISVTYFSPDFPLDKIINEVKKYIPSNKRLNYGYFENTYYFKYDKCGRVNNIIVDFFKVVTFNDTCEMITMCPTDDCVNAPYENLNYMKENTVETGPVKRLSQIDKFRNRYGIKG